MKFSRETVALIKQCIDKKWIPILEEEGEDLGGINCALCKEFGGKGCESCPINFFTREHFCENTPYMDWRNHIYHNHERNLPIGIIDTCCKSFVLAEVKFLQKIHKRALLLMEI